MTLAFGFLEGLFGARKKRYHSSDGVSQSNFDGSVSTLVSNAPIGRFRLTSVNQTNFSDFELGRFPEVIAPVPGPIAGAGLPGLILAGELDYSPGRRRRQRAA